MPCATVEEMRITGRLPDGSELLGGLKMANGENPKGYGKNKQQAPFTRMKVAALQRQEFVKAREYKAKKDAGEKVERDSEAKQFSASEKGNIYSLVDAIAYSGIGQKLIANFYLNKNNPSVPNKVFTDKKINAQYLMKQYHNGYALPKI